MGKAEAGLQAEGLLTPPRMGMGTQRPVPGAACTYAGGQGQAAMHRRVGIYVSEHSQDAFACAKSDPGR